MSNQHARDICDEIEKRWRDTGAFSITFWNLRSQDMCTSGVEQALYMVEHKGPPYDQALSALRVLKANGSYARYYSALWLARVGPASRRGTIVRRLFDETVNGFFARTPYERQRNLVHQARRWAWLPGGRQRLARRLLWDDETTGRVIFGLLEKYEEEARAATAARL